MNFTIKHLDRLKKLHRLILDQKTAPPRLLAKILHINERTLRKDLELLKDWGADIHYDRKAQRYYYQNTFDLLISYDLTIITAKEQKKIC